MTATAETPQTLVVEKLFSHSPEKLWRALTESSLIAQWLMNNDFVPEVGRKFQFRSQPVPNWDGLIDCEVLIVEPLKKLAYTWATMGATFNVLWTITPENGGTHVRMEQSNFGPGMEQAYGGAKYGWNSFLNKLEKVLDGGAA
jgi:uncharacterized protein YndB with AHSA1/START domain